MTTKQVRKVCLLATENIKKATFTWIFGVVKKRPKTIADTHLKLILFNYSSPEILLYKGEVKFMFFMFMFMFFH